MVIVIVPLENLFTRPCEGWVKKNSLFVKLLFSARETFARFDTF